MAGAARAGHHNIKAHKWQESCRLSPLQETRHTFSCRVGWGLILCQSPRANPKPLIPNLALASCSRLHGNWAAASCLLCMLPYCPVLLSAAGQSETCPWSSKAALPVLFPGCVDGGNAAITSTAFLSQAIIERPGNRTEPAWDPIPARNDLQHSSAY